MTKKNLNQNIIEKSIFKFVLNLFVLFNLLLLTDYSFAQSQNEIINIRAGKHSKFYRIVVETSRKIEALVELKKNPYRAIIKIPESLWRANSTPRKGNFFPNIPVSYSFRNNEIGKTNLILNVNKPFRANVGIGDSMIIGLVTKISIREEKEVDIETLNQQNEDNLKNELLFTLTEELQKELSSEVYPERLDFLFETINAQGSF